MALVSVADNAGDVSNVLVEDPDLNAIIGGDGDDDDVGQVAAVAPKRRGRPGRAVLPAEQEGSVVAAGHGDGTCWL